jgi:hypothetical protein
VARAGAPRSQHAATPLADDAGDGLWFVLLDEVDAFAGGDDLASVLLRAQISFLRAAPLGVIN